jgi:hypothetical protein
MEVAPTENGIYQLPLCKGDEALLFVGPASPDIVVSPLPVDPEKVHPFGGGRKLKTSLATGKQAAASSSWSDRFGPDKAFDNDLNTRWAGVRGTRSGWLEVDLGRVREVRRVVIHEVQFPSTREFSVACEIAGRWEVVARGTTIAGTKRLSFKPVRTCRVRLNLLKTVEDVPTVGEFQVF